MRIVHAAIVARPSAGIRRQMESEAEVAQALNLPWQTRLYEPARTGGRVAESAWVRPRRAVTWLGLKFSSYLDLYLSRKDYDWLVLRYSPTDPFLLPFILLLKRRVTLMHHTIARKEFAALGVLGKMRGLLERLQLPLVTRASRSACAVTREIADYVAGSSSQGRLPPLIYPNGIVFGSAPLEDERNDTPTFLMLASDFAPWHGLDLLVDSVSDTPLAFVVHVVGPVPSFAQGVTHDSRWRFHGHLPEATYRMIAAECWAGIDSMAIGRKGMTQACTLKSRGYLELGLPVLSGHEDLFPSDFPFFVQVKPDVRQLVRAAEQFKDVSRERVAEESRPYIEKATLLGRFYSDVVSRHSLS